MKKQLLIILAILLINGTCKAQNASFKLFGQTIDYQTGTLILSTINTTLTTLNLAGLNPKWQAQYTQGVAVVTGACQLGYGIYDARKEFTTLNIVNITAGAATIIANGVLLYKTLTKGGTNLTPKNHGKKPTSWNLYSSPFNSPFVSNKLEFGIRVVKSF